MLHSSSTGSLCHRYFECCATLQPQEINHCGVTGPMELFRTDDFKDVLIFYNEKRKDHCYIHITQDVVITGKINGHTLSWFYNHCFLNRDVQNIASVEGEKWMDPDWESILQQEIKQHNK